MCQVHMDIMVPRVARVAQHMHALLPAVNLLIYSAC
jgi:hypothetical protein